MMSADKSALETLGLYIHVPFCRRKCPYCDFYSCTEQALEKRDAYTEAVCHNLRHYGNDSQPVDTIYFGGGTPSLLSAEQVGKILTCAAECFCLSDPEITMEVNPATVDAAALTDYRQAGVNRLSIGVQDVHDETLKILGRLHTAEQALQTVQDAVKAGFENISCDLIIGTKGQTQTHLSENIAVLTALPITHISAYLLKVEEGTPYAKQQMQLQIPDEDETADLYLSMVQQLEEKGFLQYEISNFAKVGFESRHNCRYWRCQPYLGIGPAAHSCMTGQRFFVPPDLDDFLNQAVQTTCIEEEHPDEAMERILLGLRLAEGIPMAWLDSHQQQRVNFYAKAGLMQLLPNQRAAMTPEGFLVSNAILADIL